MSDYSFLAPRVRKKHLFIVEGEHEKDTLFSLILKCFPEIDVDIDRIIVYGTNIYNLYQAIVDEYDVDWIDKDVDLPYVVSIKKGISPVYNKRDFNNILLVFDYERHHPRFCEDQIIALQRYFNDMAGNGQLYLNYPMIESYRHFKSLPDPDYEHYSESSAMATGNAYKNLTQSTFTLVHNCISFPQELKHQLQTRFNVIDSPALAECVNNLLLINNDDDLFQHVNTILNSILSNPNLITATHYITHKIQEKAYTSRKQSFFEYARWMLRQIAVHNIHKANKVQNGVYSFPPHETEDYFLALDWTKIVENQNEFSRNELTGIIWILNTSILFIPEYDFGLLDVGSL